MAKGLRASVNKANKSSLRSRVFAPIENARTERLSAKLLELASQPKPERPEMEVDGDGAAVSKAETSKGQSSGKDQTEAMEVDSAPRPASASFKKKSAGIRKQRRSKSTTTFKSLDRRRAKLAAARKKGKR